MGFFKNLFEFKFQSYITPKVIGVIYAIMLGISLIFGAFFFIGGLIQGEFLVVLLTPIGLLLYIVFLRMIFESSIALIAVAENTAKMARNSNNQ